MAITIKKETATQFLVAADNVGEVRGIEKIWSVGDKIYFLKPDGEIFDENYKKISVYDLDAEEPSEINSLADFLSLLKTIGFGNFNTAGATALPYKELILTAVQTEPVTLTSGELIIGGKYRIAVPEFGDDFTNCGAPDNEFGTEFIATGTIPTDWSNASTLEFKGNPILTVLNNPTGDNFLGVFVNEGDFIIQSDADTFSGFCWPPEFDQYGELHVLGNNFAEMPQVYFTYYKLSSSQYVLRSAVTGDLTNNIFNGKQLIRIKLFNP